MSEALDNTINTIQNYIKEIIKDMITIRTKYVEASEKIIDKLRTLLDQKKLNYVLRRLYDYVAVVESDTAQISQVTAPDIKLVYRGGKMTLQTDSGQIEVPEVPLFEFKPVSPQQAFTNITEAGSREMFLIAVGKVNGLYSPDYENVYYYYYRLNYFGCLLWQGIEIPINITLFIPPVTVMLKSAIMYEGEMYYREFSPGHFAKVIVTRCNYRVVVQGVEALINGLFIETLTSFDGELYFLISGVKVSKGVRSRETGNYANEIYVFYSALPRPLIFVRY